MRKREWMYLLIAFCLCLPTFLFDGANTIMDLCIDYWWLYCPLIVGFGFIFCSGWDPPNDDLN